MYTPGTRLSSCRGSGTLCDSTCSCVSSLVEVITSPALSGPLRLLETVTSVIVSADEAISPGRCAGAGAAAGISDSGSTPVSLSRSWARAWADPSNEDVTHHASGANQ